MAILDNPYDSIWKGKQIDDAIGRIINLEIDHLAQSAANSATQAAQSANNAKNSATQAANSANAARDSAAQAANSANAARDSAAQAANSANAARDSAAQAANSANAARDSAAQAANSATQSGAFRDEATQARDDAKMHADNAEYSAYTAKQYSGKPPIIKNDTWWTWDASKQIYVDTHISSRGNVMYATFWIDANSGDLYMFTDIEYAGPTFRIVNDTDLEVVLTYGN